MIRNFEIIGEASRNIERYHPEFAAAHAEVPWGETYLLRNQVAHGYFKVDMEIVLRTVRNDLPGLRLQIQTLYDKLGA